MFGRCFSVFLLAGAVLAQEAYQDPDLPPEKRAADLISRMTLEEKVSQMQNNAPAIPRLDVPAYDWWNEAARGGAGGAGDGVSAGDWAGGDVGHEPDAR